MLHRPDRPVAPDPFDVAAPDAATGLPAEGFRIEITDGRVDVYAGDPRGQRYAALWLVDRLADAQWESGVVEDAPALRLRAFLAGSASVEDYAAESLLDAVAAARLNAVILRVGPGIQLETLGSSGISTSSSEEAVRLFLHEAAWRHIAVIPEIKLLTHQEHLLAHSKVAWRWRSLMWPTPSGAPGKDSYNPLATLADGRSIYDGLLFPLLDEITTLSSSARPLTAMHLGHDEAEPGDLTAMAADAARPAGTTAADVFVEDILRFHDHLTARGIRPVVWADMLLDPLARELVDAVHENCNGRRAVEGLAADQLAAALAQRGQLDALLAVNWQYGDAAEYLTNDYLAGKGFVVAGATWKDAHAIVHHTEDQVRLAAPGMVATHWGLVGWLYGDAVQYLIAFSGETFWSGAAGASAPDNWPEPPRAFAGDAAGNPRLAFAPGETIHLWVAARDAETPTDQLRGWTVVLSGLPTPSVTAQYFASGAAAGADFTWRVEFVPTWDDADPSKNVQPGRRYSPGLRFADGAGFPSITTVDQAFYIGQEAPLALPANGSFEDPVGGAGNWAVSTPDPRWTAGVTTDLAHTGSHSMCSAVLVDCVGPATCQSSYWNILQNIDATPIAGQTIGVRYWSLGRMARVGRAAHSVRLDLRPTTLTWPGSASRFLLTPTNSMRGLDAGDWQPHTAVVEVPAGATQVILSVWEVFYDVLGRGQACWDDVELVLLSP